MKKMPVKSGKAKKQEPEILHINTTSGRITAKLRKIQYRDKDTRQIVIYLPSVEITGYGTTEKKALEMINFLVDDFFEFLLNMKAVEVNQELIKLGWIKNKVRTKDFSKAYVDIEGKLQEFNAVADLVEEGVLTI
jgi:hypothetical protein